MKRNFLTFLDLDLKTFEALIKRAVQFKKSRKGHRSLEGCILGLLFEKESTRTRVSFEVAMNRLGGSAVYLGTQSSQLSRGESYADTARVLSRYVDGLVLRTFGHERLEELAQYATIPVINGLTDLFHPCQVLADLLTIKERKGCPKGQKIAYVGDGNNMANTWIEAALLLPLNLHVACPAGFWPDDKLVEKAKEKSNIHITEDVASCVKDADVINTDTWFSMGQEVSDEKRKCFKPYQVNQQMLQNASSDVIVLHCLPAHRGEEITNEVLDGPHSAVFDQAENRLYVQMAVLEMLLK